MKMHQMATQQIDRDLAPAEILAAAHGMPWAPRGRRWARSTVIEMRRRRQVLALTGTIGLLDGLRQPPAVEPDFALIKFKKLAGGGSFKIVNQSVPVEKKR